MLPKARFMASGSSKSWGDTATGLSPGTLYPMLHAMERKGYLRSRQRRSGRSIRRLYRTTALGEKALKVSKEKLRELVWELIEGE